MQTDDEADLELLSLANDKRKFGIEVGLRLSAPIQRALERGMDNEWFTLIDVTPIAVAPGHLLRLFRLTNAGMARLSQVSRLETTQ